MIKPVLFGCLAIVGAFAVDGCVVRDPPVAYAPTYRYQTYAAPQQTVYAVPQQTVVYAAQPPPMAYAAPQQTVVYAAPAQPVYRPAMPAVGVSVGGAVGGISAGGGVRVTVP